MIAPAQVMMLRPSLDNFPQYSLPSPFTIRWYEEGDEQLWLAIKARSDHFHHADLTYYLNTYGAHADLLPERQAFLCDREAQPIGTTTAWFEDFAGQHYGKVNWVCIVPEAQEEAAESDRGQHDWGDVHAKSPRAPRIGEWPCPSSEPQKLLYLWLCQSELRAGHAAWVCRADSQLWQLCNCSDG